MRLAVVLLLLSHTTWALLLSGSVRRAPRSAVQPSMLFNFGPPADDGPTRLPPGHAEAAHILIRSADPEQDDATAETLLNRIEAGELTFAEAASKFSSCPSRGKRGELGAFPGLGKILFLPYEGQDVPEFDALVFSPDTELNKLYKVRTQFGTHLVIVSNRA